MRLRLAIPLLLILSACTRQSPIFSLENARAHVQMLAGTIGSRPIGTPANARARQYVIDQLRLFGYDVRVQEVDARRPEVGYTARVANIIAVKPGPIATPSAWCRTTIPRPKPRAGRTTGSASRCRWKRRAYWRPARIGATRSSSWSPTAKSRA